MSLFTLQLSKLTLVYRSCGSVVPVNSMLAVPGSFVLPDPLAAVLSLYTLKTAFHCTPLTPTRLPPRPSISMALHSLHLCPVHQRNSRGELLIWC